LVLDGFRSKPENGAVTAVQDIVAASSLAAEAVARHIETMPPEARPSPDQIRDAGRWLELLARALEDDERERPMH
jgi:hypothetical protein